MIELDISDPWELPEPTGRTSGSRWMGLAGALLLLLMLTVADMPQTRFAPVLALPAQAGQIVFDPDGVLYAQEGTTGAESVRAYHLPTGRRLWSLRTPGVRQELRQYRGLLVVTSFTRDNQVAAVRALDSVTGQQLWSRQDKVVIGSVGDLLILVDPVPADAGIVIASSSAGRTPDRRLVAVHSRTGAAAWSTVLPADAAWTMTDYARIGLGFGSGAKLGSGTARPVLAVFGPDGQVVVRDLATGQVNSSANIGRPPANRYLVVSPATVALLWEQGGSGSRFQAYDLVTGRPTWTVDVGSNGFVLPCGEQICLSRAESTAVLDPANGAVRRTLPNSINGFVYGDRLVSSGDPHPKITVTNLDTAGTVRTLDGWTLAGSLTDGRIVVVRQDPPTGRTVIATLDPDGGQVAALGVVQGWTRQTQCLGGGAYLVCTAGATTKVWRIDASALA